MNALAFILGLITLGLVKADVSHLKHNQHQQSASGHTFVANNGQVVKQSFNSNGDATYSSRTYNNNAGNVPNSSKSRYWWMNTETQPFTRSHKDEQNYFAAGCNGCASRTLNIKHDTQQHTTQNDAYSQNPSANVKHTPVSRTSHNHIQSASVSGSPREVNNFFSQQGFDSGRIQQSSSCADSNSACVAPKFCYNGFIDRSAEHKAVRSASGKCFAPELCCRFAQRRNAPYNQDNAVAAAESTSEVLTKEGYVVRKPSNQYLPSFQPAPSNDDAAYARPQPQRPVQQPQRPIQQPQRPIQQPQRPIQQPQRPIATQPPRIQPTRPAPTPQRPPVYQPQQSVNRPVIQYDPAPIVIPVGCAAALNCTQIQFCTANGVISKTPVTLTPQQEMFRVPMTDCREPSTNQVGKCCRDPDYVDPWPVGRTGQYVAEELNNVFDSGAYKSEPSGPVPVRVRPQQDGYVLPQPSNTQNRLYLPPSNNRI